MTVTETCGKVHRHRKHVLHSFSIGNFSSSHTDWIRGKLPPVTHHKIVAEITLSQMKVTFIILLVTGFATFHLLSGHTDDTLNIDWEFLFTKYNGSTRVHQALSLHFLALSKCNIIQTHWNMEKQLTERYFTIKICKHETYDILDYVTSDNLQTFVRNI